MKERNKNKRWKRERDESTAPSSFPIFYYPARKLELVGRPKLLPANDSVKCPGANSVIPLRQNKHVGSAVSSSWSYIIDSYDLIYMLDQRKQTLFSQSIILLED